MTVSGGCLETQAPVRGHAGCSGILAVRNGCIGGQQRRASPDKAFFLFIGVTVPTVTAEQFFSASHKGQVSSLESPAAGRPRGFAAP